MDELQGPTKRCPYCAEEIKADAVRCRFCGGVVVSDNLRSVVERWSKLPQNQQDAELESMSNEQRSTFRAAWEALGYATSPATQPQQVAAQESRSGCAWIFIIAFGIIAAILIISLF